MFKSGMPSKLLHATCETHARAMALGCMKRSPAVLLLLLVCSVATAQTDEEARRAAYRAKYERIFLIEERMSEVRPERRDSPVRSENIRDQEVKEVQGAVSEVAPGALVNIGTVVTGCPCEDGPDCTDQVWVIASKPEISRGVLLSKIKGHWTVGAVQAWWLTYEKLQASRHNFSPSWKYREAEDTLKLQFPLCVVGALSTGEEPNKLLHATRETRAREQWRWAP